MTDKPAIAPFHVMDILAQCKQMEAQGADIVHMEIGEPDFASPQPIVKAGIEALQSNQTHYTAAVGLEKLRIQISGYYHKRFHVQVNPEQIIVTPGASGALQLVLAHVLRTKKSILISDPSYPCNRNMATLFGGKTQLVPVTAQTNFQLDLKLVKKYWHDDVAAVLIATPSNPTGTVCEQEQLVQIADWLAKRDTILIVDEIYQGLVYDRMSETVAGLRDNVYVINSLSKYFGMTGWRVGWLLSPEKSIPELDAIAQNTYLAASTIGQYAAMAAFSAQTHVILEQRRDIFMHRRNFLCESLVAMGIELPVIPQGAFYIYANVSNFTDDSFSFCKSLLHKKHVAITPGCDFGYHLAEQYVRFAYTTGEERLRTGMRRLQDFLATL